MWIFLFVITELIAGLVQGITGFGSGPIQMITYTMRWPLSVAAAVSVCVSVALNLNMFLTYRREVHWTKILLPLIPYMVICAAAISFSMSVNQALMKKIFGAFLIVLAVYYLFFNHNKQKPFNLPKTILYVTVSALCDAFFGIGGPLMVLYFLNKTESSREYLGTMAGFFLINGIYSTGYRLACGILPTEYLPYAGLGIIVILIGVTVAHRVVDRLNDALLKKITYIMIGVSGVFNLIA